jgi:hypothetical protein
MQYVFPLVKWYFTLFPVTCAVLPKSARLPTLVVVLCFNLAKLVIVRLVFLELHASPQMLDNLLLV